MYELVGKQELDFDKDGQRIKGIKLHYLCPDDRVVGKAVDTRFFRADSMLYPVACALEFGEFNFVYGPRNRVEEIVQALPDKSSTVK